MSRPTLAFKSAIITAPEAADLVVAEAEAIVAAGVAAFEGDGVVTAIVSVTGVVDEVDDIIVPGAYRETLIKRIPKVCWHHSWDHPIGKTLQIEELMPGDPRLPSKTRDGQPWPAEAGALIAKMQMNMDSERGREAYSAIKFYSKSGECEYSIGYKVPAGKSTRDSKGIRHIKVMDLFELSFVLFGAHTMTGTLALKTAVSVMNYFKSDSSIVITKEAIDAEFKRLMDGIDFEVKDLADDDDDDDDLETPEDDAPEGDEPGEVGTDDQEVLQIGDDEDDEEAALHVAALADPEFKAEGGADQNRGGAENLRQAYLHGKISLQIDWPTAGAFGRCVAIAGKHMTDEQAKGYCANRHKDATGEWPGAHGDGDPEGKAAYDQPETTAPDKDAADVIDDPKHTGVMVALFPDPETAKNIVVHGGEDADELHVTLAFLGKVGDQVGDGLTLEASTSQIVAAVQIAAASTQPLAGTIGGVGKFPDTGSGVPVIGLVDVVGLGAFREAVVEALTDAGLPVKTDHGFTPHMTLGYNLDMSLIPDTEPVAVEFTHAVVAVGGTHTRIPLGDDLGADASGAPVAGAPMQGEQMAGEPMSKAYDPTIETGPDAGNNKGTVLPADPKGFPRLAGTLEERTQALSAALDEALLGDYDDDDRKDRYVNIDGTWTDRVICTMNHWTSGSDTSESFEFPYTVNEDGSISLGDPVPVKLTLTAEVDGAELTDVPVGDLLPMAEMIEQVTHAFKSLGVTELKAGRVLSASIAGRLKNVVETLLTVLAAGGINIEAPGDQDVPAPTIDMETTAPSAHGKSLVMPDPAQVAALLAEIDSITNS